MVEAIFEQGSAHTHAPGLTQWDYGQKLVIRGIDWADGMELHFAESNRTDALVTKATQEEGTICGMIPDKLLESGHDLEAYVYTADEKEGETIRTIRMPVKRRQKPKDYRGEEYKDLLRQMQAEIERKADGLSLDEEGLQLLSGNTPIGERVRLQGIDGREIELRNSGTAIEWRYTNSNQWSSLVAMEELRGPQGPPGITPEFEVRDNHLYAIYAE